MVGFVKRKGKIKARRRKLVDNCHPLRDSYHGKLNRGGMTAMK